MSQDLESTASEEVQAEAREIGWRPPQEFKGDPAKWVDADEYLRRGQEVLPLVKAANKRLETKADELAREVARLTKVVDEQRQSMDDIAKFNAEQLAERLAEQKKAIMASLREARREENDEKVEALEEELEANAEARQKLKEAPPPKKVDDNAPPQQVQTTPEFEAWKSANPWFGGTSALDLAKTGAAEAFGRKVAAEGKRGQAFFDAVDALMAEAYPPKKRTDPTEEGRPSGGSGGTSSRDSGFNALPAEAKAQARRQAAKFVGPNKMFKTEDKWFSYFAEQYNATEA